MSARPAIAPNTIPASVPPEMTEEGDTICDGVLVGSLVVEVADETSAFASKV
jgi:hypothetical protein